MSRQCPLLSISQSSTHYQPTDETPETLALMRRIDTLCLQYPLCGNRQMPAIGRHRIRRPMRRTALQAIDQARRTSKPHPEHRVYPYRLRDVAITRPYHVWCADITYIHVRRDSCIWWR